MAAYTAIPLARDYHEPLILWPPVMFLLAGSLMLLVLPSAGDPRLLSLIDPPLIITAIAFLLVSIVMFVVGVLVTFGKSPIDFIHPILLNAMRGTKTSREVPTSMEFSLSPESFPNPDRFAAFLRSHRLTVLSRVRRGRLVVRIERVYGLPRFWSLLVVPLGQTVVRVGPHGVAEVVVDPHVYRVLGRPGPYSLYCHHIVSLLSEMAVSVSRGDSTRALRAAAFEATP